MSPVFTTCSARRAMKLTSTIALIVASALCGLSSCDRSDPDQNRENQRDTTPRTTPAPLPDTNPPAGDTPGTNTPPPP